METGNGASSSFERVLWRLVLVLLVVGCVLSVFAALGGDLSPRQVRMLVSSYGVAVYAGMGLACASVVRRQPTSLGARAGLVVAFAAGVLLLLGVWTEIARLTVWWKAFGITSIDAFAACLASLLLLVTLDDRFGPVRAVTRAAIYAWAGLLTFMIVLERGDDVLWRMVAVTAALSAFGVLSMPVLAKLSQR